jgi:sucrose synthase
VPARTEHLEKRLFKADDHDIYGYLENPAKIPVFTLGRFDRIKNITGLIEAFGMSKPLRKTCNLIFSAGSIRVEDSRDREEEQEIRKAYGLIDQYKLQGSIRWLPTMKRSETGEAYRIMADRGGIFVQPALFEAFGLTILEAMYNGLPTFGPKFGGPSEIIEYGKSGFLLNTSSPALIARSLEAFFKALEKDKPLWQRISQNGIRRVEEQYTWSKYSGSLINLSRLYSFWRFTAPKPDMEKMNRYWELLFQFLFRKRISN